MTRDDFDKLWSICFGEGTADHSAKYIQQDETEMWEFCQKLAGLNPQKGLEIGNFCGGTTLFWQALAPQVVSIDLEPAGSKDGKFPLGSLSDVTFILGDSHDQEILRQAAEFAPYDFLFIDGDHEPEGVLADYQMYSPLVRPGGIVAFHDWGYQHESGLWPIQECIKTIRNCFEVIQHSHFGIAMLHVSE